jgi:haloacetate dehalogenase
MVPDSGLFKGFEAKWVRTNGADIFLRHGGKSPPLLLLHSNPQTLACWHKIAEPMAKRFHVVVAADAKWYNIEDVMLRHFQDRFRCSSDG